jgi:hypothetical protein
LYIRRAGAELLTEWKFRVLKKEQTKDCHKLRNNISASEELFTVKKRRSDNSRAAHPSEALLHETGFLRNASRGQLLDLHFNFSSDQHQADSSINVTIPTIIVR